MRPSHWPSTLGLVLALGYALVAAAALIAAIVFTCLGVGRASAPETSLDSERPKDSGADTRARGWRLGVLTRSDADAEVARNASNALESL